MNTHYIVNARFLAMASAFQSSDPGRSHLNGVAIQPHPSGKGVFLISTDGHRMAVFHDVDGIAPHDAIFPVTRDMLTAIKALVKRAGDTAVVEFADTKANIGDVSLPALVIGGTFPAWRRVIPPVADPAKFAPLATYNPSYLGAFAFKGWRVKDAPIELFNNDGESPVIIRLPDVPEFLGVLMPVRSTGDIEPLPDWLAEAIAEETTR